MAAVARDLVPASFVERPNRFIVRAALRSREVVEAHLPDPGRLKELLLPGAELRLRPAPAGADRRTGFSVVLVRSGGRPQVWVSLDTTQANRLAERLLIDGELRGVGRGWDLRREVRHGDSRFDFCLRRNGERLWIEVKSVTLVERGVGLFPDAPTERGRRHVEGLARRARAGERAEVLFVAQRADAACVRPHAGIDPAFADALTRARAAGVRLRAARFELDARGRATYLGAVPVRQSWQPAQ